ncbi:hypothetical protein STEG23_032695, partial [Scotinomys teguina]
MRKHGRGAPPTGVEGSGLQAANKPTGSEGVHWTKRKKILKESLQCSNVPHYSCGISLEVCYVIEL